MAYLLTFPQRLCASWVPAKYEKLKQRYVVNDPEHLEMTTRMQAQSPEWHNARQNRLTASNFGQIITRKASPNENLLSRLFHPKQISSAPLAYGKRNESKAKAKYLAKFPDRHLHECGFVVNNEFPFLGATPDGKLCDKGTVGIVEIKCPFSARDFTVKDACSQISDFFLQQNQNGEILLKKNHSYYAQVQGQLMITGCSFCDFIVYCPNESDLFVQRILPDTEYMKKLLSDLVIFFETYAQPYLNKINSRAALSDHDYTFS